MSTNILKRSSMSVMFAAFVAAVMTMWTVPVSAELAFTAVSSDARSARDRPRVAKDADGNYHIVYRLGEAGSRMNSSAPSANVGYMMLDADGGVLIDEVRLTTDVTSNTVTTADIQVGSDGKVYVSFGFHNSRSPDLRLIKLDPSLAPQDGSSPDLADITAVAEVQVDASNTYNHPFIKLDADDNVFVWSHNGWFAKYDSDLVELIAPFRPLLTEGGSNRVSKLGHSTNPIALDSKGNVHLVFQDDDSNLNTISYAMLRGSNGNVLIDATNVITEVLSSERGSNDTVGDPPHAVHYSVLVDSEDNVNLVWVDKRNAPTWDEWTEVSSSGGTLHYAKLDPSLDDRDGDAADMSEIKVISDVGLGPHKYAQAFIADDDSVHIFFGMRGGMSHIRVNNSNGEATDPVVLASNAVSFASWNKAYPAAMASDGHLFWPMVRNSNDGAGSRIVMGEVALGEAAAEGKKKKGKLFGGLGTTLLAGFGLLLLRRRTAH